MFSKRIPFIIIDRPQRNLTSFLYTRLTLFLHWWNIRLETKGKWVRVKLFHGKRKKLKRKAPGNALTLLTVISHLSIPEALRGRLSLYPLHRRGKVKGFLRSKGSFHPAPVIQITNIIIRLHFRRGRGQSKSDNCILNREQLGIEVWNKVVWNSEGIEGLVPSKEKHGVDCVREGNCPKFLLQYKISLAISRKPVGNCLHI